MEKFMKKFFLSPLLVLLILGGCGNPHTPEDIYSPGVYTASALGFNKTEPLVLKVEFSAVKILGITIESHGESKDRTQVVQALSRIPKAITEKQSVEVDVVSRATATSRAIIAAVEDCIAQARITQEN
jgi:fumarate reductase flavoprotein subunit